MEEQKTLGIKFTVEATIEDIQVLITRNLPGNRINDKVLTFITISILIKWLFMPKQSNVYQ